MKAEIEQLESKNEEVQKQIQETELRVHEQEHKLYLCRREIEAQRILNNKNKHANEDLEAEKEALEKHATTMHLQNEEITAELDRFIQTDEVLLNQLKRRSEVYGLSERTVTEVASAGH